MKLFNMLNNFTKLVFAALCLYFGALNGASADVFNTAEFRITQSEGPLSYQFTAMIPKDVARQTDLVLPESCVVKQFDRQTLGNQLQLNYNFSCTQAFNDDASISTPWALDGARLFSANNQDAEPILLSGGNSAMVVPLSKVSTVALTLGQTVQEYIWQGMLHIWFGWDHLAFVLCLCLLASGYRLFKLITLFTVGHSLTLVLAYYQVVVIPIAPVEVLIALSIVLMASEALSKGSTGNNKFNSSSFVTVLLFGLIHGLGFASALSDLGMSPEAIGVSLASFNIGVEVGQVLFILCLVALKKVVSHQKLGSYTRLTSLYFVGALGMYWAIERVAGFGLEALY
ncbi:HupE/UreJ family protein [Paraglaciecola sp. 2405UD69-4]|uniref:HupE/UreJ family protein n=1 Tax=Paraglaciecola sp. 2405UD69-4 TaxID=3391836 RepID=UPI0039C9F420